VIGVASVTDAGWTNLRADSGKDAAAMDRQVEVPMIGRRTSRIGFGTGGLLRIGSARRRQTMLDAALASGITHFDTAPIYGLGESERALGRFLRRGRREVTLTTKFGLRPSTLAVGLAPLQRAGRRAFELVPALRRVAVRSAGSLYSAPCFSLSGVRASLEASLRALRTDYVDFYLAHQASPDSMPDEELIEQLERLRTAGKILAFGVATDFDKIIPVLNRRPPLTQVVQFDSDVSQSRALGELVGTPDPVPASQRLVITYGSLHRSIALCRTRLSGAVSGQDQRASALGQLDRLDDETIGGMLLRAAVLQNPSGIVLMQSRSIARIARNVEAANYLGNDEQVRALVSLFGSASRVVEPVGS
jgi:D-threo-aldose 1-dehydrogenase